MFFKQVYRNAAKNRKGNGLFFGSLVIAIVAFYTLLSLGEQDVMRFLATIESDAVRKLMMMLPIVYIVSLFFVFFLVYFACKYQIDNRRKEFGMYLMLGMKHSRLFFMLFCEMLWSSLISLLIGLPIALFLTEGISLATAKIVGLGIIGHHFSLSISAIKQTIFGFIIVQLLSMLVICIPLGLTEPADLLKSNASAAQTDLPKRKSTVHFTTGILLLIVAYGLGVFCLSRMLFAFPLLISCGISGTFLLYSGLGGFLGMRIRKKSSSAKGLTVFTGRQVQESVLHQYKALAISSLLLLLSLSCVSYGISIGIGRDSDARSTDFSLLGDEKEVTDVLNRSDVQELTKASYPVYLSGVRVDLDVDELENALSRIDGSENIIGNIDRRYSYLISVSSYNNMLQAMEKKEIDLSENQVALYSSLGRGGNFYSILDRALKDNVSVEIKGTKYELLPDLYYDNIVADRAITLYTAFIVPDELYANLIGDTEVFCYNLHLKDDVTEELGLMQAIQKMDSLLSGTGLEYDTYLSGIGRNLFYTVAASYLTIYLGVLFLLIANTVIGLKYLIQQRQNKHRYLMLLVLGADTESICVSVKKQIKIYFALVLSVAAISSIAAICSMFMSLTKLPLGTPIGPVVMLAGIILIAVVITEITYIWIVTRTACREIRSLK